MESLALFKLASSHLRWLSARQTVIAQNVANANTPGFKALDVTAFGETKQTRFDAAITQARHMAFPAAAPQSANAEIADAAQVTESGNSVALDEEMTKLSQTAAAFEMNARVATAFHRMLLTSAKG